MNNLKRNKVKGNFMSINRIISKKKESEHLWKLID